MLIFSDRFNNGWGDSWSWMPRYTTNNPVYLGGTSMACAPSGSWQAWWLKAGTEIDTRVYSSITFWLYGSTSGQTVGVTGELDGSTSGQPTVWVTAPNKSWQKFTISLSSLGVDNKLNLTGFQFANGTTTSARYLDDVRLVASPTPALVQVNVNASQTVRTVSGRVFAINQVAWDGNVNTPATSTNMTAIGATCMRWPGGSWGDGYHWTNEPWMAGATSARNWGSFSKDFIPLATNLHSDAFIIVNYGSSSPEEAAYGVRMFNLTNHCNFRYWEIGNEVGGSWELDYNTNAPWKPHDPWTYAMRFTNYYAKMKAADPTIKIGAVVDITEDGTSNYSDHPVVNPRTGQTHNGWTPVMLTYMRSNNVLPDFVIIHNYGPAAGDTQDLLWSRRWSSDAAVVRQMLTDYLGAAGNNITMEITENGTGGERQSVSLPGGLFYADSIGQVLQTEFNSRIWWDFRNGGGPLTNPDPEFYGWRNNSDGGICYGIGGVGSAYPAYYVARLMPYFGADGDTVVPASTDYPLLATYAIRRSNGALSLLVINKSCSSNITASFNLSGYSPTATAAVHSYGIPQDEAARTGIGSPDIVHSSISGVNSVFTNTFAPFSVSVLVLSPGQPPLPPANLAATASNAAVALTWAASSGASTYTVKRSLNSGGGYSSIATNATLSFTDTGLNNGTRYYYVVRAVNASGESSDSTEASARPTSPAPVQFTFVSSPGQLQLNWPVDHTGWRLQSQTNSLEVGLSTNWVDVAGSTETNQVFQPASAAAAVFFRLVWP